MGNTIIELNDMVAFVTDYDAEKIQDTIDEIIVYCGLTDLQFAISLSNGSHSIWIDIIDSKIAYYLTLDLDSKMKLKNIQLSIKDVLNKTYNTDNFSDCTYAEAFSKIKDIVVKEFKNI